MDWIYGQIVGFLGNFFALMGNMGVELFELEWVSAIILFFSRLAWALFAVSVVRRKQRRKRKRQSRSSAPKIFWT